MARNLDAVFPGVAVGIAIEQANNVVYGDAGLIPESTIVHGVRGSIPEFGGIAKELADNLDALASTDAEHGNCRMSRRRDDRTDRIKDAWHYFLGGRCCKILLVKASAVKPSC